MPAAYIGIRTAPYIDTGLFGILLNLKRILSFRDFIFTPKTLPTVFAVLLIYTSVFLLVTANGKHYRFGEEYGSAKFGDPVKVRRRYSSREYERNRLFTENVRIATDPLRHRRNLNTIVCGGSGSGKTRYYCLPNILQANASMVILDPKGELYRMTSGYLESRGYAVKVLDLLHMYDSHCYNPFRYINSDNDVQKLVTNLFNSTNEGKHASDPFWDTAAQMLLSALIFYLHYEAPEDEQNFDMVMDMLRAGAISGEKNQETSVLDLLFYNLEEKDPSHVALKYYRNYRSGAPQTLQSIQITLAARLEKFNLRTLSSLTITDEMELDRLGEKKMAVFAIIPDNDPSFNFLVSILYTQLFQQLFYIADNRYGGTLPVPVHFIMDEFANVALPVSFDKILSVMRSRNISVSIILQNMAQLRALFEKEWESIVGNCDELLYLGGNEKETHKYLSELIGRETIDTNTFGRNRGRNGSMTINYAKTGRALISSDEIRVMDNRYCLLFIRGENVVLDRKYPLEKHPSYRLMGHEGKEEKRTVLGSIKIETYAQNGDTCLKGGI